jgi:hypothetical protein
MPRSGRKKATRRHPRGPESTALGSSCRPPKDHGEAAAATRQTGQPANWNDRTSRNLRVRERGTTQGLPRARTEAALQRAGRRPAPARLASLRRLMVFFPARQRVVDVPEKRQNTGIPVIFVSIVAMRKRDSGSFSRPGGRVLRKLTPASVSPTHG